MRSFSGYFFCRSEKALIRPRGSDLDFRISSMPPPGMMRTGG